MTDLLERLGWAGLTPEAAIAQAASAIVSYHGGLCHSDCSSGHALKLLRKVTKFTNPKRGQVKARQAEIMAEYGRQHRIHADRRLRSYSYEMRSFSQLKQENGERFEMNYTSYKAQRVRLLGARYGVQHATGFRRYGDMLIIATGGMHGSGFNGLAIRHPDGTVNLVQLFSLRRVDSFDGLLASLPSAAIFQPESLFARAALEGASVTADLRNLQTTIVYPNGESVILAWTCQTVQAVTA